MHCRHCGRTRNRARLRRVRRGWACVGCRPGGAMPVALPAPDRAFESRPPPDAVLANVEAYRRRAACRLPLFT